MGKLLGHKRGISKTLQSGRGLGAVVGAQRHSLRGVRMRGSCNMGWGEAPAGEFLNPGAFQRV